MIICPNCNNKLNKLENRLVCKNNHSFDIAKEGYVNLLLNKPNAGDNLQMIKARRQFLDTGFYEPIGKQILKQISTLNLINPFVIDIGCGEGYYTNFLSNTYNNIIGIDISKDAIRYAARKYKHINFIVANANNLPIKNESTNLVINIFSPDFISEFYRVLKGDNFLVKVTPNNKHLLEIKQILYEDVYLNQEKRLDSDLFEFVSSFDLRYNITCSHDELLSLFTMTPFLYTTSIEKQNKLKSINSLKVTIDCNISIYEKNHS